MQDEIWHQFGIQNYNGAVYSVMGTVVIVAAIIYTTELRDML